MLPKYVYLRTLFFFAGCLLCLIFLEKTAHAYVGQPLSLQLGLFQYDGTAFQPLWQENGKFARLLQNDLKLHAIHYLTPQTNIELNDVLNDLKKKIRIRFSPKVILKPFILVEEIQDLFVVYQSKRQRQNIHIDENFQAKLPIGPSVLSRLKKMAAPQSFSVSPYYRKIYGLHLQICW